MSKMIFTGDLLTGDFQDKTMTFEIDGEMTLQAGNYTILPTKMYEELVSGNGTSSESERVCLDGCFENGICTKTKANCARGLCSKWQTKA